ncbi:GGDEF domain-containing protein [Bacillus sp. 31A1R]|uniref:GGDEF domain-containing protein n=1 Tax=Robertmurraya mangrovi TaxID=3098077 RepID=A0ABU5J1W0_9BACI|nr:GGDEF domain-containing protein [Bacillus sp. 31A1R]MDZ5473413.1 GGDEF domain-containing protein [Bacillus sp. 31A1R]
MRLSLYLDDYETEKIFSYLRWIFLAVASILFYVPPFSELLHFNHTSFPVLLTVGLVYMTFAHIALMRMNSKNKYFSFILKAGIVFDYVALIWLLILTGGVTSPLFPITYLLIIHSTIYWRTKGAFVSSIFSTLGYSMILALESNISFTTVILFSLNLCFIWVVGLFGSMIVVRERKHLREKEQFYELMVTDYLTGLYNHKSFQEELKYTLDQKKPFVLIMGDIDYFKLINDRYGHMMGDQVLSQIGKLFKEVASSNNGKAFRYGGEEFAFIFPYCEERQLVEIFSQVFNGLNELSFTDDHWKVSMSFGVSESTSLQSRDQLLSKADRLLYDAKKQGKNRALFEDGKHLINHEQYSNLQAVNSIF